MPKSANRRWVCPTCGAGRLAPSRPRRDDVRRFCLSCSEASGRLVPRVCPANERARERSCERSKRKATRRRASARKARERAAGEVRARKDELAPYERFLRRALRLRAWEVDLATRPPRVSWRRSSVGDAAGSANATRVSIRLGAGVAGNLELVLHELAHVAYDRAGDRPPPGEPRWHNSVFRQLLAAATAEVTGLPVAVGASTGAADAAAEAALAEWLASPDCWFGGPKS